MKMERVSKTQMKFVLDMPDLKERDIQIADLDVKSTEAQRLFKEIMHLVQDEDEFVENCGPLMFECIRVGVDSLVVMVTKVNEHSLESEGECRCSLVPSAKGSSRFRRPPMVCPSEGEETDANIASYVVFSFATLDMLAAGASRLAANFCGTSSVHKMEGKFFLAIENETKDIKTTAEFEAVLHEYGEKHISDAVSKQYLFERGEVVIAEGAVEKLRLYHAA
jgi:negative regulator of genetic competence, sporulation and motility